MISIVDIYCKCPWKRGDVIERSDILSPGIILTYSVYNKWKIIKQFPDGEVLLKIIEHNGSSHYGWNRSIGIDNTYYDWELVTEEETLNAKAKFNEYHIFYTKYVSYDDTRHK